MKIEDCKTVPEFFGVEEDAYIWIEGEMAKKLFISSQGYGKYERGESEPNLVMLKKICIVLDISADWLLEIPI